MIFFVLFASTIAPIILLGISSFIAPSAISDANSSTLSDYSHTITLEEFKLSYNALPCLKILVRIIVLK